MNLLLRCEETEIADLHDGKKRMRGSISDDRFESELT